MARIARLVVPGLPHHVTQRGNRRLQTFFEDGDFARIVDDSIGDAKWLKALEKRTGQTLAPGAQGRKANQNGI